MEFQTGDVIPAAFLNAIPKDNLEAKERAYWVRFSDLRYADGLHLGTTAAAGKPAIVSGGYNLGSWKTQGEDAQAATKTETVCFQVVIPGGWSSGLTVSVQVRASDAGDNTLNTATVDMKAYRVTGAGDATSNLVNTATQTFNKTWQWYNFSIDDANLTTGDLLTFFVQTVLQGSNGGILKAEIGGIKATWTERP